MVGSYMTKTVYTDEDIFQLIGVIICIGGLALNIIALAESVEATFDEIQNYKEKIMQKFRNAKNKEEIEDLKYCKSAIKLLKPMSAAGYFEIGKSTLTSMLSVRFANGKAVPTKLLFYSLTYIIILVQFKMSEVNSAPIFTTLNQTESSIT